MRACSGQIGWISTRACGWNFSARSSVLRKVREGSTAVALPPPLAPNESVLLIRLRPNFSVVFGGYAGGAINRCLRQPAPTWSLRADTLQTCCLRDFGEQFSSICLFEELFRHQTDLDVVRARGCCAAGRNPGRPDLRLRALSINVGASMPPSATN